MKAVKKEFPIKYKKDIAMNYTFEEWKAFCKQYKNIKIEPDVMVAEYESLTGKKAPKQIK